MLIEAILSSLIIGKIRKGKLRNIEKVNFRGWYLFIIGFLIEFTSVFVKMKEFSPLVQIIDQYFLYIHGFSYLLIFIGLILNFDKKSMILVFIGTLLNLIVIMANGGKMPVSPNGLKYAGLIDYLQLLKTQAVPTHMLMTEKTKLYILGDIIPLPEFYPFAKVLSIGDIFIAIGIFSFIQSAMISKNMFNKGIKYIRFN
ncbi:DUF5317 domain-containing protein [Thermohalobacter berrensis]|uniref:DUF5317 domain-containing protein n=1 Tax=Thermohalobacter berrensis TaxID=99594 RepID=A0A419T9R3_9FIRM|nr:DUF5317 domain-containing protein [Thermohalobacter berrensis]RKD34208.1 hypothetical protein BET03_07935 [Thermohalobacter berrensis]